MDKTWIMLEDRTLPQYENGVQQFLDFAYSSKEQWEKIRCPCTRCNNVYFHTRDDVEADLFQYGILKEYVIWMLHGEELDSSDNEEYGFDDKGMDNENDVD
ncbi:hypothetical protein C2S51_025279 [Perilla frutescens var. frutescens]|nr:hypothetical protein C2S51_025279 [Perilla frutescens var. frutescens]